MNENNKNLQEEEALQFWSALSEHFRWAIDKHERFSYYYLKRLESLAKFALTQLGFLIALNAIILSNLDFFSLTQFFQISLPLSLVVAITSLIFIVFKASIKREWLSVSLPDVDHIYNAVNQNFKASHARFSSLFDTFINANRKSNNWAEEHQKETYARSEQYEKVATWLVYIQVFFFVNIALSFTALAVS